MGPHIVVRNASLREGRRGAAQRASKRETGRSKRGQGRGREGKSTRARTVGVAMLKGRRGRVEQRGVERLALRLVVRTCRRSEAQAAPRGERRRVGGVGGTLCAPDASLP